MRARGAVGGDMETNLLSKRSSATRDAILVAAERLFAELGLKGVSHRLISSTAGQGNVAAVNYHFGGVDELVAAIISKHSDAIGEIRRRDAVSIEGSVDLEAWLRWLVCPVAEHLEGLGSPTWWARFTAQVGTDPHYREQLGGQLVQQMTGTATIGRVTDNLARCLDAQGVELPATVLAERVEMLRILTVHVFAEREAVLAGGGSSDYPSWSACAEGLVRAIYGLMTTPAPAERF